MAIILLLYLALIFVLVNLVLQIAFYLRDAKERISLKISLKRQVKPKDAGVGLARVGKIRSTSS